MIPESIANKRKGIIGILILTLVFLGILLLISLKKGDLSAVGGISGGIGAIISALLAFDVVYQNWLSKLPNVNVTIDSESRYHIFQLAIKNYGGGSALNVNLEWLLLDPETGENFKIPTDCYGKTVGYSKYGTFKPIRTLGTGEAHFIVFDGYYNLFDRYKIEEPNFLDKKINIAKIG